MVAILLHPYWAKSSLQDGDKIADNIRSFFYQHSYSEIMLG